MTDATPSGWRRFWRQCQRFSLSWWGQLTMLMILLGRILWGMWSWRDLTYGDTSGYFQIAADMISGRAVTLVFSPLYVSFYSWFIRGFPDAFTATTLHRIVIVILLSASLLALARTLLPKAMAWLVTAWWVLLPINWNALYEVHLFGFLPLVLGSWLVSRRAGIWSFGSGLALIWAGALLVRNEYALSVALLTVCCLVREFLLWRRQGGVAVTLWGRIFKLAVPGLVVTLLAAVAYHRSWKGWQAVQEGFAGRHTLNMAQVYPFSYQQRHPEWTKDPWVEGKELMQQQFGKPRLTFSEAFRNNPSAMWEHVWWHLELLPAGLQLGMFDFHYGPFSPDFTPPRQRPLPSAVLSVVVLVLLAGGAWCLWGRRAGFRRFVRSHRFWSWLALLCLLPPCFVAIITQRPRPSYIFPLSFFLMICTGACLYAILRRWRLWVPFQSMLPFLMVLVVVAAPRDTTTAQIYSGQRLKEIYDRMAPFAGQMASSKVMLGGREFVGEMTEYLKVHHTGAPIPAFVLGDEMEQTPGTFQSALNQHKATVLYLDEKDLRHEAVQQWLHGNKSSRWVILAQQDNVPERWVVLIKSRTVKKDAPTEEKEQ